MGFREVLVRCLNILNAVECQAVGVKVMDAKDIVADIKSARDFINRVWKVYVR